MFLPVQAKRTVLRVDHPFYHDEGTPMQYHFVQEEHCGPWVVTFEGEEVARGQTLAEAISAAMRDAVRDAKVQVSGW